MTQMTITPSHREEHFISELNKRGFEGFDHHTDFRHLEKIVEDGFVASRNYVKEHYPELGDNACQSVIEQTSEGVKNCSRFYFYPGTPTNYCFDKNNPTTMAYLVFDYDICHDKNAYYSNGNAGSSYSSIISVYDYYYNYTVPFFNLDYVFHRAALPFDNKYAIKNARHSELLIKGTVSLDYLRKIVFKTEDARDTFWSSVDKTSIKKKYMPISVVDRTYFA